MGDDNIIKAGVSGGGGNLRSIHVFFDTKTRQTVYLPDIFISAERGELLEEQLENESERFLRFPMKYEIHDYRIIKQFIYSLRESIK